MRSLMRNRRAIFYKNYRGTTYEEKDNRKTGRKTVTYDPVKVCYGTVSTPTGTAILQMFGTDEKYDKTIALDKTDFDINENSVLWIDKPYEEGLGYDYIVKRVVRNRNFLFLGVRKVNTAYAETNNTSTQ